ncbi:hypothetical protein HK405_011805 [Cladochytrium tenue]|nr:hypothetical protein HK405_011805 [Cladochytrium tenue]
MAADAAAAATDLRVTAFGALALAVKFYLTITIQGGQRFRGGSRPPEDKGLLRVPGAAAVQSFGTDQASVSAKARLDDIRWQRIVNNDLENLPLGLILAYASLQSPASHTVHRVAVITFVVSRILHTWAYANKKQPHRAIFWFVGVSSALALAINAALGSLYD